MSTRTLSFILVAIWLAATVSLPLVKLWGPLAGSCREGVLIASFEDGAEGWSGPGVSVETGRAALGSSALRFDWENGGEAMLFAPPMEKGERPAALVFQVMLLSAEPDVADPSIKPILFFKNKDGDWYQACGPSLRKGEWITCRFDVSPRSLDLQPVHQAGAWNGQASRECRTWGISFSSCMAERAAVLVDNVRIVPDDVPRRASVFAFEPGPAKVEVYDLYEASFDVSPIPDNPFDPDRADITAVFSCPDGRERRVPAFFYRPYRRVLRGEEEALLPAGASCWKVRFTPTLPGSYTWRLEGAVMGKELAAGPFTFTAVPSSRHGFVRLAEKPRRYFRLDDGTFFYPIGHNFRSPNDPRTARLLKIPTPPDKGTFRYDEILPRMAAAGENSFEVWMASWFAEIEWVARWKNYHGLGDYNLANAWKLDYVLEAARRYGMKVNLVIDNHGKYSTWVDDEWKDSPFNIENGGFLSSPVQFWSDRRARLYHRNKLRYIVARWGYSPAVLGFELVSELDLTGDRDGDHKRASVYRWHEEMANFLKSLDCNRHLVSTHYSQTYRKIDPVMALQPFLDYIVGDAYYDGGDIVRLVLQSAGFADARRLNKPYFITEYGGTPWGSAVPRLHADLHSGIWATYMTNMAGTPFFWWFDLIDRKDWYYHFAALAKFNEGESREGRNFRTRWLSVTGVYGVRALGLLDADGGYAWVYHAGVAGSIPEKRPLPKVKGAVLVFTRLPDALWSYEVWNTRTGEIMAKGRAESKRRRLDVPLPPFEGDVAVKLRRVRGEGEEGR